MLRAIQFWQQVSRAQKHRDNESVQILKIGSERNIINQLSMRRWVNKEKPSESGLGLTFLEALDLLVGEGGAVALEFALESQSSLIIVRRCRRRRRGRSRPGILTRANATVFRHHVVNAYKSDNKHVRTYINKQVLYSKEQNITATKITHDTAIIRLRHKSLKDIKDYPIYIDNNNAKVWGRLL